MPTATFNEAVLVDTDDTVTVEGNLYFPLKAVGAGILQPSDHTTVCHWKGTASYFHVAANGARCENAAWTYENPKDAAANIRGRVAFWKDVEVTP